MRRLGSYTLEHRDGYYAVLDAYGYFVVCGDTPTEAMDELDKMVREADVD